MSKVLCPVDFSQTSLNAIEFAANIASRMQTGLELINVFTEEDFKKVVDSVTIKKSFKEQLGVARNKLQSIAEEINKHYGTKGLVSCEHEVYLGELDQILHDHTRNRDHRMIVMGTTGVGKRPWLGSNTGKVIQKSSIPVVCVPSSANYTGFDKIVYASDFMEEDKVMLQDAISFAVPFNARLYVLHLMAKSQQLEALELKSFFSELKSFVKYDKITFEGRSINDSVSGSLLDYMKETDAGLLIVYSKNRGFFEKLFHKSVALELSVVSNKPLMVLK